MDKQNPGPPPPPRCGMFNVEIGGGSIWAAIVPLLIGAIVIAFGISQGWR